MPASRTLCLALVSRLAIVPSGTRNDLAISAVVSPASVRSVSATLASSVRAGWQQVNMSRNRSSGTPLSPQAAGSSGTDNTATSCSFAASVLLRRSRSSARLRAVVVSHALGRSGTPSDAHLVSAAADACCVHSSAGSQLPVIRIRLATILPHSCLNAPATANSAALVPAAVDLPLVGLLL